MGGANPSMVIRVAATIAELKANLVEGKSQIETTTASMAKMAASLSGEKLIQSAHNITAAVHEIGGASKLTEAEAARVNATLEKALDKYRALGKEAPAAMVALAEATKQVEAPTEGLSTKMVALGTAIGTMAANAAMALAKLTVEGIGKLITGMGDLILTGAGVADVAENFDRLTAVSGLLGGTLLGTLREGTHATVTNFELMKLVNQDLAAGMRLTDQQFGTLSKGAFALAQATGTDVKGALDTMNDAMLTGRTRALALLTGKIDLEAAETKYATALGVLSKDLTENEKLEAARAAILDSVTAATVRLGEQTDGLDEKLAQAQTAWANFKDKLGQTLATSPVLGAALESLGKSMVSAFGGSQETLIAKIASGINKLALIATDVALVLVEWGHTAVRIFGAVKLPVDAIGVAFTAMTAKVAGGIATLAELTTRLPGVGGAMDGVAAAARSAASAWERQTIDMTASLASSWAMVSGQGAVHGALDKTTTALVNAKVAMVAASLATAQAKPTQQAFVAEIANQEGALVRAAKAARAFDADVAKFNAQGNQHLPAFTGLLGNVERTITTLAESTAGLAIGLHFAAETIEDEVIPPLEKTEAAIAKISLSWAAAMDLVRQGQGTMTGTVTPDLSGGGRASTQEAWDEGRYYGPVVGGTRENPRGTGPDFESIGYKASGGPVSKGVPYMVGELGPEMFIPERSGTIVPNGGGGGNGGGGLQTVIVKTYLDSRQIAEALTRVVT